MPKTMSNLAPNISLDSHLRFTFSSGASAIDLFFVVDLDGFEAIGRPFRFTLTLAAPIALVIDAEKILNDAATLTIRVPGVDGQIAAYHGVLAEFDELQKIGDQAFYRAVLVPRLARAALNRLSDVYLKSQPVAATIKDVLLASGLPSSDFRFALSGQYETRESVCQYQESSFDFVSRWLEKEGMYYYFEHGNVQATDQSVDAASQRAIMVIVDDTIKLPADVLPLYYRPPGHTETGNAQQAVQQFICRRTRLPKQVVLQDFNYHKAALPLRVVHQVAANGSGDVMIYGEDFRNEEQGHRYAKLRAEELACSGMRYFGESTAVGLRSASFVKLNDSPLAADASGHFLVTEITHSGSQATLLLGAVKHPFGAADGAIYYRNRFTAIPGKVPFRTARTTPKPYIAGSMSARIDADSNSIYANLDQYGQYNIQMPFIQHSSDATGADPKPPDHGSARIRMATPYAGSDHGMAFPLHRGTEVLLSFLNGDPDQPVIVNAVPNSDNASLVNNKAPQYNRIVSAGGNKITLDDTAGSQEITLSTPNGKGAVSIGGEDGNSFFTMANTNSVTVGATNHVAIGPNHGISLSTETKLSAALATNLAVGMSLSYSLGSDIKWNSSYSRTTSIDDGVNYSLKDENRMQSCRGIYMSGGYKASDSAKLKFLEARKDKLKTTIAQMAALSIAVGTAAGVSTATVGHSKHGTNEVDTLTDALVLSGVSVASAIATGGLTLKVNNLLKQLIAEYQELNSVSEVSLDGAGIFQEFKPLDTLTRSSRLMQDGITLEASEKNAAGNVVGSSELLLRKIEGCQLLAYDSQTGSGGSTSLELKRNGSATFSASEKIDLTAKEIVLTDGGGAMLAAEDGSLKLLGKKVELGILTPGPITRLILSNQIADLSGALTTLDGSIADCQRLIAKADSDLNAKLAPPLSTQMRAKASKMQALQQLAQQQAEYEIKSKLKAAKQAELEAQPDPAMAYGISISDDAVKMQFYKSGIKATAENLAFSFGGASLKFDPVGVDLQGSLIKIG